MYVKISQYLYENQNIFLRAKEKIVYNFSGTLRMIQIYDVQTCNNAINLVS